MYASFEIDLNRFYALIARLGIFAKSHERDKRARLSGITSVMSQGLNVMTGLVSIPLTINYLGKERYGVWLTLVSLLTWLALSDLGFGGNALVNTLAEANGKDSHLLAQKMVSTAFWSLVVLAGFFALGFAALFPFISWARLFNVSNQISSSELQQAIIFSFGGFLITFPAGVVGAVYRGYQEGYIGNLWSIGANLLSLLALLLVTRSRGGLGLLVLAMIGTKAFVTLINAAHLFLFHHRWLLPKLTAVSLSSLKRLLSLGAKYLVAQLSGIGMFQSQPLIITQLLGPAQVGVFNVTLRLLSLPLSFLQMFSFPLMPAYGEAKNHKDWAWIRFALRRSLRLAALCLGLTVPLAVLCRPIVQFWAGQSMLPTSSLIIFTGLYVFVSLVVTPYSVMLYGLEKVGGQAVISFLNAVLTVGAAIVLVRVMGLSGIVVGMLLGMVSVNLIGQCLQSRAALKSLESHN